MLTASVKFRTHAVSITQHDDGHITCFKHNHNNSQCEYESFTDKEAAGEYIIKPLPTTRWAVEVD